MTSKNNRALLLYYIKLCVPFQIHRWIQTEVTLRKRSIRVEIGDFFVPCDLEIWWMTLENNRARLLYYIKLCASFQIHRWNETEVTARKRSICVKIGTSSMLLQALCVISYPLMNSNWSYSPETLNLFFFEPCVLEILRMTLKNNRASLLCYFKFCVSFRTNWWIQIGVTVRKRPIWVKFDDF